MNSGEICDDQEQQQHDYDYDYDYDCVLALASRGKARKEDAVNGQDWAFGKKLLTDRSPRPRGPRARIARDRRWEGRDGPQQPAVDVMPALLAQSDMHCTARHGCCDGGCA